MPAKGIILVNSSLQGVNSQAQTWDGGRSTLAINATQYGSAVALQVQGPSGAWIPLCSSIVSDQVFAFDAPPGQYRIANTGSSIAIVAALTTTPYI